MVADSRTNTIEAPEANTVPCAEAARPAHGTPPPSALLDALSRAFSYPRDGIESTLHTLRALGDEEAGAWADGIRTALDASGRFADGTAEKLAYTRLFIGSLRMEAPPYASYYLEENHTLNGRAAVEVEAVYAQFGIELDAREIAPPDHLRYLLAFLALLARRFEETGDAAFAQAYFDFRDDYLLTWISECADLVERCAEEPYYPALMRLIEDVLHGEGVDATPFREPSGQRGAASASAKACECDRIDSAADGS